MGRGQRPAFPAPSHVFRGRTTFTTRALTRRGMEQVRVFVEAGSNDVDVTFI
jgi:hypothetical protein